jgi:hypothetical protein
MEQNINYLIVIGDTVVIITPTTAHEKKISWIFFLFWPINWCFSKCQVFLFKQVITGLLIEEYWLWHVCIPQCMMM